MNIYKEITGHGKDIVILHGWGGCNHKHMQPTERQNLSFVFLGMAISSTLSGI